MILAQAAENTAGTWGAAGAFSALILVHVGKLLSDARKDKRDARLDQQKADYLKSISETNQQALTAQKETKAALDAHFVLGSERHQTLLAAVNRIPCASDKNQKQITI